MRSPVHVLALVMGLLVWSVAPAWGQVDDAPRLDAIWEAYQQFEYEAARELARAALDAYEDPEDLAEVLVILGLISLSENRELEAELQFREALRLNRNVKLDPLLVSPKILDFFEEVKAGLAQTDPEESLDPGVVPRYVLVPDRRSEAVLRSMVLPGWGQLYKGDRTKGIVLLGVWGLTAAGSLTAHVLRQQAQDTYLEAATSEEALDRYDTFNRRHKLRNALFLGAAGVWLVSYFDALLIDNRPRERRSLLFSPSFSYRQMHLTVRVHF